jgi:gluconokinase
MLNVSTLSSPLRILLIMGVAGSGKTTIGRRVAAVLGWPYFEADDFHPPENKIKMARGMPLDDSDRAPWLASIRAQMDACRAEGRSAVFTCSALKAKYRAVLDGADVVLVHLAGDIDTILARVSQREGHYMKAEMVRSQFEALEAPTHALTLDARLTPERIVAAIVDHLKLEKP